MDMAVLTEPLALPDVDLDPGWVLEIEGFDPDRLRVNASLFALADGRFGISGAPLASRPGARRWVLAGNVYVLNGPGTRLLTGPVAMHLPYEMADSPHLRRVLDLRAGVLMHWLRIVPSKVTGKRISGPVS
jgi:hypothetical protein